MLYKESRFTRTAYNVRKLGAYYTDVGHAKRIGRLFDFDSAEEICVLEPSIGDGKAVLAVTDRRENCKIFGVELQEETYEHELKDNPDFEGILNQDFLRGVKISHGVFSFCFANPPYGVQREEEGGQRLESLFLSKISGYLRVGGYLVYVIPYQVFSDEKFFRQILNRYELLSYYRFDDAEYAKYHQVALVLKKKRMSGYLRSLFEEQYAACADISSYPYLPALDEEVDEQYPVPESRVQDMEYFTSVIFDAEAAEKHLCNSALYDAIGDSIFQKHYTGCDLNQPIIPVSKDISYLLAMNGGGQGLAGSLEDGTLHLQRGEAKRQEDEEKIMGENGVGREYVKEVEVTTYTKIGLNIIENDGTITHF